MTAKVNLIKLCVGAQDVDDLEHWQNSPRAKGPDGLPRHITRMWPKRAEDLLAGGSLYWVFKGSVLARQLILRLDEVTGGDGIRRCAIVLDPTIIRTAAAPKRPFQGWRYLKPQDAPPDLPKARKGDDTLPPELDAALAELGLR
ncbi:DUF1489 family protein [Roseinatronobacter sp. S2]|uniref:DUF1489 family protein n=1 Tax=Roseinatronobacter sp. S2 TaxID=3035471 RepID=UPI00240F6A71|nr:DUF1489 domain-containing protein [Roseinatronobacter sp. S2]MCC5961047.1 DUF1489 domain-containing protein [Paracoccaceae bacterium]WFE75467.1 DUF1489 domain-containing protein [Roseinatronobacter sp. S2]